MTTVTLDETIRWIRVEAPSPTSAFALEKRLAHLHPSAVGRGTAWCVEIEDFDDRREEIEAAVRQWLRETGIRSTVITTNGEWTTVTAGDPALAPRTDARIHGVVR